MAVPYDQIQTFVQDFIDPIGVVNNAVEQHPFLRSIAERGNMRLDGGEYMTLQIRYALGGGAGSYSPYAALPYQKDNVFTRAKYDYGQYQASDQIAITELNKASGKFAVGNLLEEIIQSVEDKAFIALSDSIWADNSTNPNDITGMQEILSDTTTLGGISVADAPLWKAAIDSTTISLTEEAMTELYYKNNIRGVKPQKIFTSTDGVVAYEKLQQANFQYLNLNNPDLGVQTPVPQFKGIPIIADDDVPSGWMCFLNFDHLHFRFHSKRVSEIRVHDRIPRRDIILIEWFSQAAFGTSFRAVQKAFTNLTF